MEKRNIKVIMDRVRTVDEKPVHDLEAMEVLRMNQLDLKPESDLIAIA